MMKILNAKLDKLGIKNFLKLGPILSFSCDALLVFYIIQFMLPRIITIETMAMMFAIQGFDISNLSTFEVNEFKAILENTMSFIFACILLYNLIFYICFYKQKKWAISYIKGYTFCGAFFSIFDFIIPFFTSFRPNIITVITMLGYFFSLLWN